MAWSSERRSGFAWDVDSLSVEARVTDIARPAARAVVPAENAPWPHASLA
jgi:hypothetical protein